MAFELVLLGALIFIFIVSFCGLLKKIKQVYDRERLLADRLAQQNRGRQQRVSADSFAEVYTNPIFTSDTNDTIFPEAPPQYSLYYVEPPPKYDEVIKVHQSNHASDQNETASEDNRRPSTDTGPPPYTIAVTLVTETANRPNRY